MSHFGLALQEYTHFTSPIRRYADVVVHRQLLQAIKSGLTQTLEPASSTDELATPELPMSHAELASAAEIMNERHRASKRAQKECSDLYLLLLLHRYGLSNQNCLWACMHAASQVLMQFHHKHRAPTAATCNLFSLCFLLMQSVLWQDTACCAHATNTLASVHTVIPSKAAQVLPHCPWSSRSLSLQQPTYCVHPGLLLQESLDCDLLLLQAEFFLASRPQLEKAPYPPS